MVIWIGNKLKKLKKFDFVNIGNHSHSHDYLINFDFKDFEKDIEKSIKIFNQKLGYNPNFFLIHLENGI